MAPTLSGRMAARFLILLTGCGVVGPRRDGTARGPKPKASATEIATGPKATREQPLADPSTMIPLPPNMDDLVPGIPNPPPTDRIVAADGIVSPEAGVKPRAPVERPRAKADEAAVPATAAEQVTESSLDAVRRLARLSAERFHAMDGFECRLTRRETVNNKPMPQEELQYKFRR